MRKRKVTYPVAKTANRPVRATGTGLEPRPDRPTVATIDVTAGAGRPGLLIGSRVRIIGNGLYSGEIAVVERFASGVIPSAHVRTESGKTRQVRTIDLEPVAPGATTLSAPNGAPAASATPAANGAPAAPATPPTEDAPATTTATAAKPAPATTPTTAAKPAPAASATPD